MGSLQHKQKYPSRFLFEIKENLLIHKGEMKPMYLNEAKNHFAFEKLKLEENNSKFSVGDIVKHPVWNEGKVINIDTVKGEYEIQFKDNKIRPINFEYKLLVLVNTIIEPAEKHNMPEFVNNKERYLSDTIVDSKEKYIYESHAYGKAEVDDQAKFIDPETLNSFEGEEKPELICDLKPENITKNDFDINEFADTELYIEESNNQSENYEKGEFISILNPHEAIENSLTEDAEDVEIEINQIEIIEVNVESVEKINITDIQSETMNELTINKLGILEKFRQLIKFRRN